MRIILITGISGSGKSVALNVLEDAGYYCVDNLPAQFIPDLTAYLADQALHFTDNTWVQFFVTKIVGLPLVGLAVPMIAAAVLFPVFCAFVPGWELDKEQDRAPVLPTAVGFAPTPTKGGGAMVSLAWKLP